MSALRPHVLTLAPGFGFARTVAKSLLNGALFRKSAALSIEELGRCRLYVPTRRFAQLFERALEAELEGRPFLVPDIRAMGEIDAQEAGDTASDGHRFRALDPLERSFALRPLVADWMKRVDGFRAEHMRETGGTAFSVHDSYAQSLALSHELGRLIDEMHHDGVPLHRLAEVDPPGYDASRFDEYWRFSKELITLAAQDWPRLMDARAGRDASLLRLEALERQAERYITEGADHPVLVLGSTGSVRASALLMAAVSRLEMGAVVLPGLDLGLDEESWRQIGDEKASIPTRFAHPQASLKRTLATIGIGRAGVRSLGSLEARAAQRNAVVSQALRPVETVQGWRAARDALSLGSALEGIGLIEAQDDGEEARAVALLIREALEVPGKTVLFVSADNALQIAVELELTRWGIVAERSAPQPLLETHAGRLLIQLIASVQDRCATTLLTLLKHPMTCLGVSRETHLALTHALELTVFRGRRFSQGLSFEEMVRAARRDESLRPSIPAQRIEPETLDELIPFAAGIDAALVSFHDYARTSLACRMEALAAALRALTRQADGSSTIDEESDGEMLLARLEQLALLGDDVPLSLEALDGVMRTVLGAVTVPPDEGGNARCLILGPLEARLVEADRVILGGANEGSFPPSTGADPFLTLGMRLALGLQAPDRRIGQSAHDFTMLAGAPDLWITRALRSDGQPGLPSRFIRRLEAFTGLEHWKSSVRARGEAILTMVRRLDEPDALTPAPRPMVVPQAPRLPQRVSITEAETLIRDPYALYARRLLRLEPLEPNDPGIEARERGTILHAVLERYSKGPVPEDPEQALIHLRDLGAEAFRTIAGQPETFRFWMRDFESLLEDFITFDADARLAGDEVYSEIRVRYPLVLRGGETLDLVGKIDRIHHHEDGSFSLIDFKTGTPPSGTEVRNGDAPQLTLSAALVRQGAGDPRLRGASIRDLAYFAVGGDKDKKRLGVLSSKDVSLDDLAASALEALKEALEGHAEGSRAYGSALKPRKNQRHAGDFDHLARRGEWELRIEDDSEEEA